MTLSIGPTGGGAQNGDGPHILLVSSDLMSTSRMAGLVREVGGRLDTLRSLDAALPGGPYDMVLLDLQALQGDPSVLVKRCLGLLEPQRSTAAKIARLVAFGPHVAKDRLDRAKDAGADAAVSRGELLGGFPAIVTRWCHTGG